jgi:hypothetical protein
MPTPIDFKPSQRLTTCFATRGSAQSMTGSGLQVLAALKWAGPQTLGRLRLPLAGSAQGVSSTMGGVGPPILMRHLRSG